MLYQVVVGTGNSTKIHYMQAKNQFVAMDHLWTMRGKEPIRESEKIIIVCLAEDIEIAEGKHI